MAVMHHTSCIKRDMNELWVEPMQRVKRHRKVLGNRDSSLDNEFKEKSLK